MRAALRELLFTEDKLYPPRLGNLAAWYDSLDPVTLLAVNGQQVTDGGTVCLWKDKSGNSGVNALVGNGQATNERAWLPTGSNVGIGEASVSARFLVQTQTSSFATPVFLASGNTTSVIAKSLSIRTASGALLVVLFGVTTSDFNAWTYSNFVTNYQNRKVTVCVTRGLSGNPKIYIDAVDVTASGAFSTGGTAPTWQGEITSTHTVFGGGLVNASFVGPVYSARVYLTELSASDVISDSDGLIPDGNVVAVDFTTAPTKLANLDTFTCTTGQTVTLNSSGATGARIAGERDLFQGTAANRPVLLKYAGTKYGYLNGTAGNYFSTPDSVPLSVTGSIDSVSEVTFTGSFASATFAAKDTLAAGERSFQFSADTSGYLSFGKSSDGTVVETATCSVLNSTFATLGTKLWVRAHYDSTTGEVKFYSSVDGVAWVQRGDTVALTATAIADTSAPVSVGVFGNGSTRPMFGRIHRSQVWSGDSTSGGTLVADFNPALYTSGTTFTASTGEVWTVNGGAHIVTRTGLYGNGTSTYIKSAAFSLSQPETAYIVGEQTSWTADDTFLSGNALGSMNFGQSPSSPNVVLYAGAAAAQNGNWAIKTCALIRCIFNGASSLLGVNRGAATTGNPGAVNASGVTLFANGTGVVGWANGVISEVAIYSAAHGTSTQDRWALYSGRRHSFAV